ncbi:glycosyltransferase [Bacteroidota bacterium]
MSDKSLILVFPFDLMSHFFRSLRVAVSLNDHYEVYMKWSDKYAYWLKKSGLQTFNCVDLNAETALEKTGEFDFSWLNASALEAVFLEQVKVIKEYNPTLVIGDTSFTLKMAAEATGVHYLSILNGYSTRYYKLTRKLSPNHPAARLINWLPDVLLLQIVRIGEAWNFSLILKEFNKVRAKYKLQKTTHFLEELTGNNNVICDLPEIFPQKNLPNTFHFIGPLFHNNEMSGSTILEKLNSNKKTILITMGSSKEWERFKFLNMEEFAKYNVIVVGENNSVMHASFLLKTPFVNFNEVLPKVDLVICHGGNGTVYNALLNKVPVLCHQSNLEQTWNVNRIEELGYGQSLNKINPENTHIVINDWIGKKTRIQWNLNFSAFNNDFQNNLLLKIVSAKNKQHI